MTGERSGAGPTSSRAFRDRSMLYLQLLTATGNKPTLSCRTCNQETNEAVNNKEYKSYSKWLLLNRNTTKHITFLTIKKSSSSKSVDLVVTLPRRLMRRGQYAKLFTTLAMAKVVNSESGIITMCCYIFLRYRCVCNYEAWLKRVNHDFT